MLFLVMQLLLMKKVVSEVTLPNDTSNKLTFVGL